MGAATWAVPHYEYGHNTLGPLAVPSQRLSFRGVAVVVVAQSGCCCCCIHNRAHSHNPCQTLRSPSGPRIPWVEAKTTLARAIVPKNQCHGIHHCIRPILTPCCLRHCRHHHHHHIPFSNCLASTIVSLAPVVYDDGSSPPQRPPVPQTPSCQVFPEPPMEHWFDCS